MIFGPTVEVLREDSVEGLTESLSERAGAKSGRWKRVPMAEINLEVLDRSRLGDLVPANCCLTHLDLAPWAVQWLPQPAGFTLQFSETDSPRLHVPFRWRGTCQVMLPTATLRPRKQPYRLLLEMARGTIDRLRNRVASWQVLEFRPSPTLKATIDACSVDFCRAMSLEQQPEACEKHSVALIDAGLAAMDLAAQEFVTWQRAEPAENPSGNSSTLRGTWLTVEPSSEALNEPLKVAAALDDLVNTVIVRPRWELIETRPNQWDWSSVDQLLSAANSRPWNVVLGPILSFQRSAWPEWLLALSDPTEIRRAVQRYVAKLMERYAGQVDLVMLAERVNMASGLKWDGPARLQLVIDAGTTLRRAVDNLPYVVGFAQPFSESQPRGVDYPAIHLADALLRANLEICGFALDFEFGDGPCDTRPRDLCQLVERLSHWSSFGLPLVVSTSSVERSEAECLEASCKRPDDTECDELVWGQPHFQRWLEILDASGVVDGVFWNHAFDSSRAGRGLLDRFGDPTERAKVLRKAFGLQDPNDTLPIE